MTDLTGKELRNWRHGTSPVSDARRNSPCMSQAELSALLGVTRNTVARWESLDDACVPKWVSMALVGVESTLAEYFDAQNTEAAVLEREAMRRLDNEDGQIKAGAIELEVDYED